MLTDICKQDRVVVQRSVFTKLALSQNQNPFNYASTRHAERLIKDMCQEILGKVNRKLTQLKIESKPGRYVYLYSKIKEMTPKEHLRDICKSYLRLRLLYRLSIQGQRGAKGDEIWRRILDVMLTSTLLASKRRDIEECTCLADLDQIIDQQYRTISLPMCGDFAPKTQYLHVHLEPIESYSDEENSVGIGRQMLAMSGLFHIVFPSPVCCKTHRHLKRTNKKRYKKPMIKNLVFIEKRYHPNKT